MARKFPCPKCGTETPVGQNFCAGCGERFDYKVAGAEQQPPALPSPVPPYSQPLMPPAPPELAPSHTGTWAFLSTVVTMLCIGAIIFLISIGSEPDGGVSNGGFSFEQLLPGPSLPPVDIKLRPEETPEPVNSGESTTETSRYSHDVVIAVAKKVSPECRVERVG